MNNENVASITTLVSQSPCVRPMLQEARNKRATYEDATKLMEDGREVGERLIELGEYGASVVGIVHESLNVLVDNRHKARTRADIGLDNAYCKVVSAALASNSVSGLAVEVAKDLSIRSMR